MVLCSQVLLASEWTFPFFSLSQTKEKAIIHNRLLAQDSPF